MHRIQPPTTSKQHIQLYISCKNLVDKDFLSKSDPFVEVYENGVKIGQTEQIPDDLNPHFSKPVELIYQFERRQVLRFVVKDEDMGGYSEHLGGIEIALGALVSSIEPGSPGWSKKLVDEGGKVLPSEISINVVDVKSAGNQSVQLSCEGHKLDKMDWFGKSDPYFEIWCAKAMVYRSEVIKSDLNPKWKVATFPFARMDAFESFDVKVFDWDEYGDNNDFMGECKFQLENTDSNATPSVQPNTQQPLINKQKSNKKPNSGFFKVKSFKIVTQKSFIQYIQHSQVKLNFTCAIDFTGSNGPANSPSSLHYKNVTTMRNQYTDALAPIFMIVQDYDTDKIFPVYGFGAKLANGKVSHHFPLNLDTGEPEMFDLPQILHNYWNCVSKVTLWGPTNFAPTIKKAVDQAFNAQRNFNNKREYSVLLILTDGSITDMNETVQQIEKAQTAPISIIIVGVGNADFSSMELLDGDGGNTGFSKVRDCVQFCSYSEVESVFQGNMTDANVFNQIKERLAAKVLEELPKQLESYMRMKHPNV